MTEKLYALKDLINTEELPEEKQIISLKDLIDIIKELEDKNESLKTQNQRLKEGILWLLEILCKKDPKSDIEFWCKTFFDCNYQTAKEKYGELSKVLWESNNNG